MQVEFPPSARDEVFEQIDYYNAQVRGLGDVFGSRLAATIQRIAQYPAVGQKADGTFRPFPIKRFPLTVVYVVEQHQVALAHQSRRAGYWINRY